MVNFGRLAAEIGLPVWGIPANFNGFRVLSALLHGSQVSQTLRPSRWASVHILVLPHLTEFGSLRGTLRKSGWRCRRKIVHFRYLISWWVSCYIGWLTSTDENNDHFPDSTNFLTFPVTHRTNKGKLFANSGRQCKMFTGRGIKCSRAVDTAREHGWWTRVSKNDTRVHGPCWIY